MAYWKNNGYTYKIRYIYIYIYSYIYIYLYIYIYKRECPNAPIPLCQWIWIPGWLTVTIFNHVLYARRQFADLVKLLTYNRLILLKLQCPLCLLFIESIIVRKFHFYGGPLFRKWPLPYEEQYESNQNSVFFTNSTYDDWYFRKIDWQSGVPVGIQLAGW